MGLIFPSRVLGQEGATLVDEFGELCSDDIRSRIDSFFITIQNQPNSIGYVIGFADSKMPGQHDKFVRLIRNHITFRNFDPLRVKFLRGANREDLRIQFWLLQKGASFAGPLPGYQPSTIVVPTLFDASAIVPLRKGELVFGGYWAEEPCDFGLDLTRFAEELKSRDVEAVLLATSDRERSARFVRKVLQLTKKELTKQHEIRPEKIRLKYVGAAKTAEMQLWMVPKGMASTPPFASHIPGT